MWRRDFYREPGYGWRRGENEEWDREHFENWMDTVRDNQKDSNEWETFGGTPYEGGVFTAGTYGGGAEFYSVTGMYENPLLERNRQSHRGKGPRTYRRSDDRIHDEVCERLTRHPLIDASLMDVQVKDGEVVITGEVLDRRMKHMAEDVIDEVSGVREIHNHLRISQDRAA
jgi:osmotically-inducible protein OsmY